MTWICVHRHRAQRQDAVLPARRGDRDARRSSRSSPSWKVCTEDAGRLDRPELVAGSARSRSTRSTRSSSGVSSAMFIYWGWDSLVTVNEETEDADTVPGQGRRHRDADPRCGVYVIVSTAAVAFGGRRSPGRDESGDALGAARQRRLRLDRLGKMLIIAVLTSAAASTQTTILPTARTTLSMARAKALPAALLARIHPRYLTPHVSTIWMGVASVAWYVGLTIVSREHPLDSIAALGLMIAFYYGMTGFACAVLPPGARQEREEPALVGVVPVIGGLHAVGVLREVDHRPRRTGELRRRATPGSASARRWSSASVSCSWGRCSCCSGAATATRSSSAADRRLHAQGSSRRRLHRPGRVGTVRAVVITRHGAPDVLEVQQRPDPTVGPGQVRIEVKAAGVNFADTMARAGALRGDAPKPPCVVGYEVAGTVARSGRASRTCARGDRVMAGTPFGGYAEQVVVDAADAVPLARRAVASSRAPRSRSTTPPPGRR